MLLFMQHLLFVSSLWLRQRDDPPEELVIQDRAIRAEGVQDPSLIRRWQSSHALAGMHLKKRWRRSMSQ